MDVVTYTSEGRKPKRSHYAHLPQWWHFSLPSHASSGVGWVIGIINNTNYAYSVTFSVFVFYMLMWRKFNDFDFFRYNVVHNLPPYFFLLFIIVMLQLRDGV